MSLVSEELLQPFAKKSKIVPELVICLNKILPEYGINTPKRVAAFLAQCAHETGGFVWLAEAAWCSEDQIRRYCQRYEPMTEKGLMLGNTQLGDGFRYRGRGLLGLTGRYNYDFFGKKLGIDLLHQPDLVATNIDVACRVACEFWSHRRLNSLADNDDIKGITRGINGGCNGLDERTQFYNSFKAQVKISPVASVAENPQRKPVESSTKQPQLYKMNFNPGVYVMLCEHSYDISQPVPDGWMIIQNSKKKVHDPSRNASVYNYVTYDAVKPGDNFYNQYQAGYHGTLYMHMATGNFVLVHVGTDFANVNGDCFLNLVTDLNIVMKTMPEELKYAEEFYREAKQKLEMLFPGRQVDIEEAGHSKGGAICELRAVDNPERKFFTIEAPGVRELLPLEKQALAYHNVVNFVMAANVINKTNMRIGITYRLQPSEADQKTLKNLEAILASKDPSLLYSSLMPTALKIWSDAIYAKTYVSWLLKCHGVKTCLNAFDKVGKPLATPTKILTGVEKILPEQTYFGAKITPNLIDSVQRSYGGRDFQPVIVSQEMVDKRLWDNFGSYRFSSVEESAGSSSQITSSTVNVISEGEYLIFPNGSETKLQPVNMPLSTPQSERVTRSNTRLSNDHRSTITSVTPGAVSPPVSSPKPSIAGIHQTSLSINVDAASNHNLFDDTKSKSWAAFLSSGSTSVAIDNHNRKGKTRFNILTNNPIAVAAILGYIGVTYLYQWLTKPAKQQTLETLGSYFSELKSADNRQWSWGLFFNDPESIVTMFVNPAKTCKEYQFDLIANLVNEEIPKAIKLYKDSPETKIALQALLFAAKNHRLDLLKAFSNKDLEPVLEYYVQEGNSFIKKFNQAYLDDDLTQMSTCLSQLKLNFPETVGTFVSDALLLSKKARFDQAYQLLEQAKIHVNDKAQETGISDTRRLIQQQEFSNLFEMWQASESNQANQLQTLIAFTDERLNEYPNDIFWNRAKVAITKDEDLALCYLEKVCNLPGRTVGELEDLASRYYERDEYDNSIKTCKVIVKENPGHRNAVIACVNDCVTKAKNHYTNETSTSPEKDISHSRDYLKQADTYLSNYCIENTNDNEMKLWRADMNLLGLDLKVADQLYTEVETQSEQALKVATSEEAKKVCLDNLIHARYGLASVAAANKDQTKQLDQINKILEQDPRQSKAWTQLGDIYFETDRNHAGECYDIAIKIDPNDYGAHLGLVYKGVAEGDLLESRHHLESIADIPQGQLPIEVRQHASDLLQNVNELQSCLTELFAYDALGILLNSLIHSFTRIPGITPLERNEWIRTNPWKHALKRGVAFKLTAFNSFGKSYLLASLKTRTQQAYSKLYGAASNDPTVALSRWAIAKNFTANALSIAALATPFISFFNEWYSEDAKVQSWVKEKSYSLTGYGLTWDPLKVDMAVGATMVVYSGYQAGQQLAILAHNGSAMLIINGLNLNMIAAGLNIASVINHTSELLRANNVNIPSWRPLYLVEDAAKILGHPVLVLSVNLAVNNHREIRDLAEKIAKRVAGIPVDKYFPKKIVELSGSTAIVAKDVAVWSDKKARELATDLKAKYDNLPQNYKDNIYIGVGVLAAVAVLGTGYLIKQHVNHRYAEDMLHKAKQHLDKNESTQAIAKLTDALSYDPDNLECRQQLTFAKARKLMDEDKNSKAVIKYTSDILDSAPGAVEYLNLRGLAYLQEKEPTKAEADFKAIHAINKFDISANLKLAEFALKRDDLIAARQYYQLAKDELNRHLSVQLFREAEFKPSIDGIASTIEEIDSAIAKNFINAQASVDQRLTEFKESSSAFINVFKLKRNISHLQPFMKEEPTPVEEEVDQKLAMKKQREQVNQLLQQFSDTDHIAFLDKYDDLADQAVRANCANYFSQNIQRLYPLQLEQFTTEVQRVVSKQTEEVKSYFKEFKQQLVSLQTQIQEFLSIKAPDNTKRESPLQDYTNLIEPGQIKLLENSLQEGVNQQAKLTLSELDSELKHLMSMDTTVQQREQRLLSKLKSTQEELLSQLSLSSTENNNYAWRRTQMTAVSSVAGCVFGFFYDESRANRQLAFKIDHIESLKLDSIKPQLSAHYRQNVTT